MASLQDCVARKVPKLLDEGYDKDQAIAVAYAMCGETAKQAGLEVIEWDSLSDQQRAWWLSIAIEPATATAPPEFAPPTVIKRLSDTRVGGYGMVWGSPELRDLEGQYFTPETYLGEVIGEPRGNLGKTIKSQIPWLFDHTLEGLPESAIKYNDVRDWELGTVDTVKMDDTGVWIEAQLKRHDEWSNAVMTLVERGALQWSSGSAPLYAKVAPDGEIKAWPIVEWSSTPTPAEPRRTNTLRLKHYTNQQALPHDEATAGQAAHGDPDILNINGNTKNETEDQSVITLNEQTARAVIKAYAAAEFETIKAAVENLDPVKQGNMIEEALKPLAAQLAEMAGVDEAMALSELVGFVASHATGNEMEYPEEEPSAMNTEPAALSVDEKRLQELAASAAAKAVQALLPQGARGAHKTGDANKGINLVFPRSRHEIRSIKNTMDLIYAIAHNRHDLLNSYRQDQWKKYKALGINPDTAGGYLTPVEQDNQIIELLRDTTKVLPLCRSVPMSSDTREISKQTGGATAGWVGENSSITASQETFGQIRLVAQKLAALVQVSNELIADSDPDVEAFVREDIARVLALEVDRVILEGSGLANQPTGVLNLGITTTALNAAPTYANLSDVISRVEQENVMETPNWYWVFNPREKNTFRQLQDGAGSYIFNELGADFAGSGAVPPNLLGYPYVTTTQITPTAGANPETEIYFGQWNDVVVGMRKTIEFSASNQAGTAFQNDQTWIRAILRMDVNIRHAQSIEALTDVRTS